MAIHVNAFRGQGVRVGERYGVIHGFVSPTTVRVRFRDGFDEVSIDQLLPVVALESVAQRYEEKDIEFEIEPNVLSARDAELEPELSDDESEVTLEPEVEFEEEYEQTGD